MDWCAQPTPRNPFGQIEKNARLFMALFDPFHVWWYENLSNVVVHLFLIYLSSYSFFLFWVGGRLIILSFNCSATLMLFFVCYNLLDGWPAQLVGSERSVCARGRASEKSNHFNSSPYLTVEKCWPERKSKKTRNKREEEAGGWDTPRQQSTLPPSLRTDT